MAAIYKRELKNYFTVLTGWLFIAILLLVFGIYTASLCLSKGYADFSLVPYNALFTYLIVIPLLTMRSLAEERRQKTDQLLYSSSLSAYEIIFGKYLAMLTSLETDVYAALDRALCVNLMPVISSLLKGKIQSGEPDLLETLEKIFGEDKVPLCCKAAKRKEAVATDEEP